MRNVCCKRTECVGEALKGMLKYKNIPCAATLYQVGDPANQALVEWTGEDSAPSVM